MAEYIDRAVCLSILRAKANMAVLMDASPYFEKAAQMLEKLPAADVAPVIRGRWAHLGGDEWCCSACGFVITTEGSWDKPTKKYCEDCGAKKDGGSNDATDGNV